MVQELATSLGLDLGRSDVAIHHANIFPETWKLVTRYLRIARVEPVIDGMPDRAHFMATDSVISLAKLGHAQQGRLHVVVNYVNYGMGLHLRVCVLKEQACDRAVSGEQPQHRQILLVRWVFKTRGALLRSSEMQRAPRKLQTLLIGK